MRKMRVSVTDEVILGAQDACVDDRRGDLERARCVRRRPTR